MNERDDREIKMIQDIGMMEKTLETYDVLLACLVTRCGGNIKLTPEELRFVADTYALEKTFKTDSTALEVTLSVKLK